MLYPLLFLCCQSILRCCVSTPLIESAFRQRVHVYIYSVCIALSNQSFPHDFHFRHRTEYTSSRKGHPPVCRRRRAARRRCRVPGSNNRETPRKAHPADGESQVEVLSPHREDTLHHRTPGTGRGTRAGRVMATSVSRSEDRERSATTVASSWVSLSSVGAERRRWLA